jgi:hypothetical protein
MEERLLLNGIALNSANVSPGNVERAAAVVANLADSGLAVGNRTAMSARKTTHTITVKPLVKISFTNMFINDIAKRGHKDLNKL